MELNSYIDSTNLSNTSTFEDIEKLCKDAIEFHFASVCVHPFYVGVVKEYLKNSNVSVTTVVGFPMGMNTTNVKSYEAIDATENGADEIDMVINIAALKNKDYDYVKKEIEEVRDSIGGKVLKVIIETCLLTDEEIEKITHICNDTFVNFIKTSTGFSDFGATIDAINIIASNKNDLIEIKASGGIDSIEKMEEMINAGATRIGTSHAVEIMKNEKVEKKHNCKCGNNCKCKGE